MTNNPKLQIDQSEMKGFQLFVILMCILLNALDGFDVLAISFASPGIASEWNVNRGALGIVLSMELVGMAIGSITLGNLADRFGRRPTILTCLVLMTIGMSASATADSLEYLLVFRFLTGLGVGGMLASTNALVAEFANAKYRNLAVILMATGYPIGAIVGGSISTELLELYNWKAIFVFGGAVTGGFLVLCWFLLPESIDFLASQQPKNALHRINTILKKIGHQAIASLPEKTRQQKASGFKTLIADNLRLITILLLVAYFAQIMTFYYILKWIPKIVVDIGFEPSSAGTVLVWANVGGAVGSLIFGVIASRFRLRPLLIAIMLCAFAMVMVFGLGPQSLLQLSIVSAVTGFFTNSAVVGLYALMAQSFPAEVRASGTGVVIGIGRGGAALGPIVAGYLFQAGHGLFDVSVVMGLGAVVAAVAIYLLGPVLRKHQPYSQV
ncbi:MFS transporter [Alteromonas gilva]|uniref:MFS transporter n=1 Tax=Alteromonas gilva TaxID=2987522 RepID=A0ABT5L7S1_9ALTE|nr:MFS transporter [Alteromonas gilva]MDC8831877.1 MFS transporter [Alteromonas gilva]